MILGTFGTVGLLIPGMPGIGEICIILFIFMLLFGGKKVPELARGIGRSLSEFKRGKNELKKELLELENDAKEVGNVVKESIT